MSNKNICTIHQEILDLCKRARHTNASNYNDVESLFEDVDNYFYDIEKLVDEAFAAGRSMENRLQKYRDAIEGLGFVRDRY